ncbi:hypothetical protein I3842_04G066600 [Carya illinoinensis]|uniref:Tropomyosin n=1 Tax=Carya illinoinensis TaxID=32201 RepID=A0A922JQE2_CARIL|nr:hypothetical protein I3842_04G066600 [Carya illinoinensis]
MAESDTRKQLLTLIRDFASEKSQEERRVIGLKKRIEEVRSELDVANAELEDAKRAKETVEQELRGYEVENALNDHSIQTLDARICLIQDEISSVGSDLDALKVKEGASRDEFIGQMSEAEHKHAEEVTEVALKTMEDTLSHTISQISKEEEECQAEQDIQKKFQQELVDHEKKVSLMEVILKETKALQDMTRQTSELEVTCASLGEELQRRCACPSCHLDNVEALGKLLQ